MVKHMKLPRIPTHAELDAFCVDLASRGWKGRIKPSEIVGALVEQGFDPSAAQYTMARGCIKRGVSNGTLRRLQHGIYEYVQKS
jgi:hypothetical protein